MTLLPPGFVHAYANRGRWVAECFDCSAAASLDRFQDGFVCECGYPVSVVWPSEAMVHGVERLLLMRPSRKNQNWLPQETLHDLLQENAENGVLTLHAEALESGGLLAIHDDRISLDVLPILNPRRELVR